MTSPAIDAILQEFQERSKALSPLSIEGIAASWACFVREVEAGYMLTLYDYTNDLSSRDLLQELIDRSETETKEKIRALVSPWDERFKFSTRESDARSLEAESRPARGWWWNRIPRNLVGELMQDLGG